MRDVNISIRSRLIREAMFLITKAIHKLEETKQYYDCSKSLDFDDLHHNTASAEQFLEFAHEELEVIADRDLEKKNES